jgi:hypothetical protein
MSKSEERYSAIADRLTSESNIARSQMFGMPCLKVNGNVFLGFHGGALAFKLSGQAHAEALAVEGAVLFDPSNRGRPMKEWVQIPAAQSSRWNDFADRALTYVGTFPFK